MSSTRVKNLKLVIDPSLARAFTHPLRGHVWVTLCERGIASPKEVAAEIGLEVSEISYHFRELRRRKLIELVRVAQRRGFTEHFYQPVSPVLQFDDPEWMEIPEAIRSQLSCDMVRQVIDEALGALRSGDFDSRNRHLSREWLLVDERGWRELTELMEETLARVAAIRRGCIARRGKSSGAWTPVSVAMAAFATGGSTTTSPALGAEGGG